jgi:hypothetical protein
MKIITHLKEGFGNRFLMLLSVIKTFVKQKVGEGLQF